MTMVLIVLYTYTIVPLIEIIEFIMDFLLFPILLLRVLPMKLKTRGSSCFSILERLKTNAYTSMGFQGFCLANSVPETKRCGQCISLRENNRSLKDTLHDEKSQHQRKLGKLTSESGRLQKTMNKQRDTIALNEGVLLSLQEELDTCKFEKKDALRRLTTKQDEVKSMNKQLTKTNQDKDILEKKAKKTAQENDRQTAELQRTCDGHIGNLKEEVRILSKRCQTLGADLHLCQEEKNGTLRRLSEVLGERLKYNNPNIVDLSDDNRATKLEERYSELYDNQWTDAYELLFNHNIPDIENVLLQIVMVDELSTEVKSNNVEFMKKMSAKMLPAVQKAILATMRAEVGGAQWEELWEDGNFLTLYTQRCAELCWLMLVQSPPLYLSCEVPEGGVFNKNLYREYVSTGSHISMVVWPIVYLYEGGPILRKGVANGSKGPTH